MSKKNDGAGLNSRLIRRPIQRWAPLFILPVFAAFCIGFVWPFLQGIYLSFCTFNIPKDAKWVGLTNYSKIWTDVSFWNAFKNTAFFAVVSILLINVLAFFIAYALTQKMRGSNLFRTVFFMPNLIGGVVLGYIWSMIFDGILRNYATYLTANATYGFWGLVILVAWQQIGYMMIIYVAGLQSVPGDLIEAAKIDGAGRWQLMWHVTLPAIRGTIILMLIMKVGSLLNTGYEQIFLMQNAMNRSVSDVFDTYIYTKGIVNGQYSLATAAGLFKSIVSMVMVVGANKIAKLFGESGLY